jgi:protein-disulfide isomerase
MNPNKQQQMYILIGVVVAAIVVVGALIVFSSSPTNSGIDYTKFEYAMTEDGGFVLGDPDAPFTLVEFADYACPHCQAYKSTINQFIINQVATGRAKFEFVHFPTTGGALTRYAGQIAQCIETLKPGSYWMAYEEFYSLATTGRYNDGMGRLIADKVGVEYGDLLECTRDATNVDAGIQVAVNQGVQGTPAIMMRDANGTLSWIGGDPSRGALPYEALVQAVDAAQS